MFRQFGRIRDIIPASPSSKELPRYANITFLYMRSATAAKNCLHQVIETGTKIHISYESVHNAHWFIWDWIINHPRITIPAAAAVFAVIIGTIFDPIRIWSVENKVTKKWHMESSRVIQWLRRSFQGIVPFRRQKGGKEQVWNLDENVKKIKDWIGENQESFIVVVGPKGTAKRELVVEGVLEGRPKLHPNFSWANDSLLVIDCEAVVEQHGDSAVIRQLAQQVGYVPIFNWLNFVSSLVDLAAQGISIVGQC
jgi:RNA12 protein